MLTEDEWILNAIKGYKIEFFKTPFQISSPKVIDFGQYRNDIVDQEVSELLKLGAISECEHEEGEFISNIFLVTKKGGKFRPVVNLKKLNESIAYIHFKMENIETVLKSIKRNSYFMSFDLQNAYFSLAIHTSDRKYLKFEWNQKLFKFNCLCFGLSCAPRVFTKLMKVIFAHIRRLGISAFYYIDDSLLEADCVEKCFNQSQIIISMMSDLGFYINYEKSSLIPSTRVVYLGHLIDSVEFKVYLPDEKIEKILKACSDVLTAISCEKLTIRNVAHLIGLFTSARNAVRLSALFYRFLNKDKVDALVKNNDNFDSRMSLSCEAQIEIKWWQENINSKNGKDIRPSKISGYLETDASKSGWGATFEGVDTGGRWIEQESCLHINILETKAVYFALLSLCKDLHDTHLCIRSDNSSTVSYINNQGGSIMSLFKIAKLIWLWCEERNIYVTAVHIVGKLNTTADYMSRHFSDSTEWKLHEKVFEKICHLYYEPDIDLFATRLNKQVSSYVSWFPEPDAMASDAFSISWSDFNPYIFPPFSMISRVLQKIQDDQVRTAILIVPMWATQPWFPHLLNLLSSVPKMLPNIQNLLRLVHNNQLHPINKNLFLVVCTVSGITSKTRGFQNSLLNTYVNLGEIQHQSNMILFGTSGLFGVINGKSIPVTHLKVKF